MKYRNNHPQEEYTPWGEKIGNREKLSTGGRLFNFFGSFSVVMMFLFSSIASTGLTYEEAIQTYQRLFSSSKKEIRPMYQTFFHPDTTRITPNTNLNDLEKNCVNYEVEPHR